jgi:hypothetical protein
MPGAGYASCLMMPPADFLHLKCVIDEVWHALQLREPAPLSCASAAGAELRLQLLYKI